MSMASNNVLGGAVVAANDRDPRGYWAALSENSTAAYSTVGLAAAAGRQVPAAIYSDTPPSPMPGNCLMLYGRPFTQTDHCRFWVNTTKFVQFAAIQDAAGNWVWSQLGSRPST